MQIRGRVLIVAGSDSGGGAGVQGDIKTITSLGGYAMSAITALTVQNTRGVQDVLDVPAAFVAAQMQACLEDIGVDAIKIGMVHKEETLAAICDVLDGMQAHVPVVLDPVMVAKDGHALLEAEALACLKTRLLPKAAVLTPNVPEAEILSGISVIDDDDASAAAAVLEGLGAGAVVLKGGHRGGDPVDVLWSEGRVVRTYRGSRIETAHTHGTGCALSSAIACALAQGTPLEEAVAQAHAYVRGAIAAAPRLGHGAGPLNHMHAL